jgi:hypothetical protein
VDEELEAKDLVQESLVQDVRVPLLGRQSVQVGLLDRCLLAKEPPDLLHVLCQTVL